MRVEPRAQVCAAGQVALAPGAGQSSPGRARGEHATLRGRQLKRSGRGSAATAFSVLLTPILPATDRPGPGVEEERLPLVSVDRGARLEACGGSLEAGAKDV